MRQFKLLVLSLLCLIGLQGNMTQALGANYIAHGPTEPIWDNPYLEYTLKPLTHAGVQGAIDTAVFGGMLGVTIFGIFMTPVFYVLVQGLVERREEKKERLES